MQKYRSNASKTNILKLNAVPIFVFLYFHIVTVRFNLYSITFVLKHENGFSMNGCFHLFAVDDFSPY